MSEYTNLFYYMLWRRLLQVFRYKANLIFLVATPIAWTAVFLLFLPFYSLSNLSAAIGTTNYVGYVLWGFSFVFLQNIALWSSSSNFTWELTTGLIDYTFSSPKSRFMYVQATAISEALVNLLFNMPIIIAAILFSISELSFYGVAAALLAYTLTILALVQLGAIFSFLVLLYKNVSNIFNFLNIAFVFLTGMAVPLQVLPLAIRSIAMVLPFTFGIDLARHYMLNSTTAYPVAQEWLVLTAQLVFFGLVSMLAFRFVEDKAKRNGFHYV